MLRYAQPLGLTAIADDVQILTVSTSNGFLLSYIAKIQNAIACSDGRAVWVAAQEIGAICASLTPVGWWLDGWLQAMLSSLRDLIVLNITDSKKIANITADIEPSLIALGPRHVWTFASDAVPCAARGCWQLKGCPARNRSLWQ